MLLASALSFSSLRLASVDIRTSYMQAKANTAE